MDLLSLRSSDLFDFQFLMSLYAAVFFPCSAALPRLSFGVYVGGYGMEFELVPTGVV